MSGAGARACARARCGRGCAPPAHECAAPGSPPACSPLPPPPHRPRAQASGRRFSGYGDSSGRNSSDGGAGGSDSGPQLRQQADALLRALQQQQLQHALLLQQAAAAVAAAAAGGPPAPAGAQHEPQQPHVSGAGGQQQQQQQQQQQVTPGLGHFMLIPPRSPTASELRGSGALGALAATPGVQQLAAAAGLTPATVQGGTPAGAPAPAAQPPAAPASAPPPSAGGLSGCGLEWAEWNEEPIGMDIFMCSQVPPSQAGPSQAHIK